MRLVAMLGLLLWAASARAETVTFPAAGLSLTAELYRPAGHGPFPAVIALHGCAGLYGRTGTLSPRHADWAERLSAAGFLVLLPDSFGPRAERAICKQGRRNIRPSRERVEDALAAAAYLQSRPDVNPNAVSLLGWSNGGSTVLHALRILAAGREARLPFAGAVAFYPGCRGPLERGDWHTRIPLLLLIGEADDWTPAAPCRDLADEARKAGEPVEIVTYAGVYHSFDHPDLKRSIRRGLAFTADGSGIAHTGTDPEARADAIRRVLAFLPR